MNERIVRGIDVSFAQGTIDWAAVHDAGVQFAFVQATDGAHGDDAAFDANWCGAARHGILRGACHRFRARDGGAAQAEHHLARVTTHAHDVTPAVGVAGFEGVDAARGLARLRTVLDALEHATGRRPIVFTAAGVWDALRAGRAFGRYPLWVAQLGARAPAIPSSWDDYALWQYDDHGQVAGIEGGVDLDLHRGRLEDLVRLGTTGA